MASPYFNIVVDKWKLITEKLIKNHPLSEKQIIDAVIISWKQIFESKIGPLSIGKQIFPSPQVMSNILHELIPYNLAQNVGNNYKVGTSKIEKDIVYLPNNRFSIEIKASSDKSNIFANRSYAQPATNSDTKDKNGYYIGVNFEKFLQDDNENYRKVKFDDAGNILYPKITQIKFGYLEHSDWIAQTSANGQQARLTPDAKKYKMLKIY